MVRSAARILPKRTSPKLLAHDGEVRGQDSPEAHLAFARHVPLDEYLETVTGPDVARKIHGPGIDLRQFPDQTCPFTDVEGGVWNQAL